MKLNTVLIRSILYERDITQSQLSIATGLGRSTIAGICNGRACRYETAEKIAEVLKMTVEDLRKK